MNQLGIVKNIVEAAGMGISYAYEDLVFLDHNSLILQFTDNDRLVLVHQNEEAEVAAVDRDIANLREIASRHQMSFVGGNHYVLSEDNDETLRLDFSEAAIEPQDHGGG